MRLTIKEIAGMAQVSKGTVSKTLNGQPGVGAETRERILKLIESVNYEPSSTAQALAFRKTGNIGLIIPHEAGTSLNGAYWSTLVTSITQTAMNYDFNLLLLTSRREGDLESAYAKALKKRSVDGLIIGSELLEKKSIMALLSHEIPFVLIGRNPDVSHYYIDVDNEQGARQMANYMLDRGFRRIGLLAGPEVYNYTRERVAGFTRALREAGIDEIPIAHTTYDSRIIRETVSAFISEKALDSLFVGAGGDFMLDAIRGCIDTGIDFSRFGLTVFDDYAFLDFIRPRITAVRQPISELGTAAVGMLLEIIESGTPARDHIIFPTTITIRDSCGEADGE